MNRRGVTLIELLVTLVLLALMFTIVGPGPRPDRVAPPLARMDPLVVDAQREAIATGLPATRTDTIAGSRRALTAFPDGRLSLDSGWIRGQR